MAYKKFNALFLPNTLKTQLKRYLLLGVIFVFSNLLFNKSAFANQHCEINQISPQITSANTLNKESISSVLSQERLIIEDVEENTDEELLFLLFNEFICDSIYFCDTIIIIYK